MADYPTHAPEKGCDTSSAVPTLLFQGVDLVSRRQRDTGHKGLEGTTARRKGFALYASTQKRIRSKGHRKLLRLGRNISDQPRHLFS